MEAKSKSEKAKCKCLLTEPQGKNKVKKGAETREHILPYSPSLPTHYTLEHFFFLTQGTDGVIFEYETGFHLLHHKKQNKQKKKHSEMMLYFFTDLWSL